MSYPVETAEILKKIKAGDTIMATVYKSETTLHDVKGLIEVFLIDKVENRPRTDID